MNEKCNKQPKKNSCTSYFEKYFENMRAPIVSVIKLQGVIGAGGAMKSGISIDSVEEEITKAFNVKKLQAVAIIINSPGGSPVQSELIHKKIKSLALEKKVPVLAFAQDVAASGGYWLLCAGDEIYASENSIIGSIGVISAGFGFAEVIKKLGIERRIYTQGKNKSVLDPFSPEKEEDIALIKNIQKNIHDSFKNLVKTSRQGKLNSDDDHLFSGEFWTGKEALKLGLIDDIGDMDSVIKSRFGEKVKIKNFSKEKGWFRRKFGISSAIDHLFYLVIEKISLERFGL
jgi:signal peptide peptidase SppA